MCKWFDLAVREAACKEPVNCHAERELITRLGCLQSSKQFRGHVARRSRFRNSANILSCFLTCHTKIDELDRCRLPRDWRTHDDILWLDVSVNDAGPMHCHDSSRDLQSNVDSSR